jgi:hypothetical protein
MYVPERAGGPKRMLHSGDARASRQALHFADRPRSAVRAVRRHHAQKREAWLSLSLHARPKLRAGRGRLPGACSGCRGALDGRRIVQFFRPGRPLGAGASGPGPSLVATANRLIEALQAGLECGEAAKLILGPEAATAAATICGAAALEGYDPRRLARWLMEHLDMR